MSEWIVLNQPYGRKHIHKDVADAVIEQYNDGRDNPCEIWGTNELYNKKPLSFENLRKARRHFKEEFVNE